MLWILERQSCLRSCLHIMVELLLHHKCHTPYTLFYILLLTETTLETNISSLWYWLLYGLPKDVHTRLHAVVWEHVHTLTICFNFNEPCCHQQNVYKAKQLHSFWLHIDLWRGSNSCLYNVIVCFWLYYVLMSFVSHLGLVLTCFVWAFWRSQAFSVRMSYSSPRISAQRLPYCVIINVIKDMTLSM